MKSTPTLLLAAFAACLAGHRVSQAEDEAGKPADAKPAADAEADKKAREILAKAAERQNFGDLAEPGKLESFHVVFQTAQLERTKTDKDGREVKTLIQIDDDGLVVDWMQGSVKTAITVDGATTTKARYLPADTSWISDGDTVSSLTGDRKADYEQLELHRRVIGQLLDVAILSKLARDKSRWRMLDDASVEGAVAVRREPTAETPDALRITLWIAKTKDGYGDVVQAAMPSAEDDGATLIYKFGYHEKFPDVTRKDAETNARFPFAIDVEERRAGDVKGRPMLSLKTRSVSINSVVDADFAMPKPKPKPSK